MLLVAFTGSAQGQAVNHPNPVCIAVHEYCSSQGDDYFACMTELGTACPPDGPTSDPLWPNYIPLPVPIGDGCTAESRLCDPRIGS
jgi:hypothetical protein